MSTKGVCNAQLKEMLLCNELSMCMHMSLCAYTHMYERESTTVAGPFILCLGS